MTVRSTGRAMVMAAACLWAAAAPAASPSFDCDGARSDVEKLICQDDELAALDIELAKAFANALAQAPASRVNALKAEQNGWRKLLMNCGKSSDLRQCTLDAYRRRLDEI
jgi:uncharacterized protein